MLVVILIIGILTALLLPMVRKAKASAAAAKCMNNLRQLGACYMMYADANQDFAPEGIGGGGDGFDMERLPAVRSAGDFIARPSSHNVYNSGYPSAAGGPFVSTGLIQGKMLKIFNCPSEIHGSSFEFNTSANPAPGTPGATSRTSYAVRPMNIFWGPLTPDTFTVTDAPTLVRQKNFALMAELPQFMPYNHGTDADPILHALYGDGSVRAVHANSFREEMNRYRSVPPRVGFGATKYSADACYQEDPNARTIWWVIDHN
jgi:type II secretory pathway pseudopilin PulG